VLVVEQGCWRRSGAAQEMNPITSCTSSLSRTTLLLECCRCQVNLIRLGDLILVLCAGVRLFNLEFDANMPKHRSDRHNVMQELCIVCSA